MTDVQRAAVADTIRQQTDAFIAAFNHLDPSVFVDQVASVESFADGGMLYPSADSLASQVHSFVAGIRSLDVGWEQLHVTVLALDAGVVTGTFHENVVDKAGKTMKLHGAWTGVYQRRDGKWRIVQGHESFTNP
jgi:ketosteroid isomerase-like protein